MRIYCSKSVLACIMNNIKLARERDIDVDTIPLEKIVSPDAVISGEFTESGLREKLRHSINYFLEFYLLEYSAIGKKIYRQRDNDGILTNYHGVVYRDASSNYHPGNNVNGDSVSSTALSHPDKGIHPLGEPMRMGVNNHGAFTTTRQVLMCTNACGEALPVATCETGDESDVAATLELGALYTHDELEAMIKAVRPRARTRERSAASTDNASDDDDDDDVESNTTFGDIKSTVTNVVKTLKTTKAAYQTTINMIVGRVTKAVIDGYNCCQLYFPCVEDEPSNRHATDAVAAMTHRVAKVVATKIVSICQPQADATVSSRRRDVHAPVARAGRGSSAADDDDDGDDEEDDDHDDVALDDIPVLKRFPGEHSIAPAVDDRAEAGKEKKRVLDALEAVKWGVSRLIKAECDARKAHETGWNVIDKIAAVNRNITDNEVIGPVPLLHVYFNKYAKFTAKDMCHFIEQLRQYYDNNRNRDPILLTIDWAPHHRNPILRSFCKSRRVSLMFVPPNATWTSQPLDICGMHSIREGMRRGFVANIVKFKLAYEDKAVRRTNDLIFSHVMSSALEAISQVRRRVLEKGFLLAMRHSDVIAEHREDQLAAPVDLASRPRTRQTQVGLTEEEEEEYQERVEHGRSMFRNRSAASIAKNKKPAQGSHRTKKAKRPRPR